MREVRCDGLGCNNTESIFVAEKSRTILEVELGVGDDSRSWVKDQSQKPTADLCLECIGKLLHTYFKTKFENVFDLPEPLQESAGIREAREATR